MKKILLTMFMALTAVFAIAQTKTYTDVLQVIINGQDATPQDATIQVEKVAGGTYNLSLKNFMLDGVAVGNIVLTDISVDEANGIKSFSTKQNFNITEGEDASQSWVGPMLGEVPVDLKGKMTADKLYCTIDIDMSAMLGQVINVLFGSDITSGISAVKGDVENVVIYDLTGRRIDAITAPGVYIVNGKKQLVK